MASPLLRAWFVGAWRLLLVLYFAAGLTILVGRHFVMPEIAGQREVVEQKLSAAIGLPVKIAGLSATWPGLHPRLTIEGLQIHDGQGRAALTFDQVEAEIGWSSLWHLALRLHRLEIVAPSLDIRRDASGALFVAGLPVQGEDSGFADWLLAQGRIVVRDARLVWHDEKRGAPPLELQHLHFELKNFGRHHSFGLSAAPPAGIATQLDLRGNLIGRQTARLADWHGDLYADLVQADLAAWAPWLDLPLEWSRGSGGMRLWLSFARLLPTGFTVDLRLHDVAVRLQPTLPVLELNHLIGRLTGRQTTDGYVGEIKRLTLVTQDGIDVPSTDARLMLNTRAGQERGEFSANGLDLGALTALAGHLPLPAQVHERLKSFSPRGRFADLDLQWRGAVDAPTRWQVKGHFDGLTLAAYKELPGFAGISGRLEGDQQSGQVHLDSQHAQIDLPAVFAEPKLPLDSLIAELGWQVHDRQVDLLLTRMVFSNADANGEVTGRYRHTGEGPGEIDLSAKVTNGAGSAVWRYIPLVVNKETRDWLRDSIVGGHSAGTTLRLKGPLAKFPFRGSKEGIFLVKGTFQGATLKYAASWPEITNIDGDLLFEGERMLIRGQRGTILGVGLADVRAEIADLEVHEELLTVTGQATGATQKFLDFIEASPVGERIDHFTETMSATGQGKLDLKLVLPLRHIADSRVQGIYRFADNQLRVMPALPPFTAAQGEFGFTSDSLQAKNLRANLLGMPLKLDVSSAPGGAVRVNATGKLVAHALRQQTEFGELAGLRALDHLSGEASWKGVVTVKKPGADIRLETNLEGLSSSLPEPFNKSVRTALPLKVVGHIEAQRDDWTVSLGDIAALRMQQAGERWRGRLSLGAAALKTPASLPERGVAIAIAQPSLDVDAWRSLLSASTNGAGKADAAWPLAAIDIKSKAVRVTARDFHDVQINGVQNSGLWRFNIDSREAQGQMSWDGTGSGLIAGHLSRLALPAAVTAAGGVPDAESSDASRELPAVDLRIDDFHVRDMALGEVRVNAENRNGAWQAKLDVKNDAARLTGTGRWRPSQITPETALNFKLEVTDAEKLLARLKLADAVRRGTGRIEGDLTWAGAPFSLDIPSLSGHLKADVGKGQFKKLEPGVGRLLGVLSLQSLPRRITLDFRDVFSEGFAFDSIVGEANVSRGMMDTDELQIRGPAAKVLLSGRLNLAAETQDLKVRVQPALGESIAVGAMLANPAVGAVVWLAQKALNDPLDQVFAYEYAVTGAWGDPQVEKINRKPAVPATSP